MSAMAAAFGDDVAVVDVGIAADCLPFPGRVHHRPVGRSDMEYILLQCCFCHSGSSIYPCAASQCSDGRAF